MPSSRKASLRADEATREENRRKKSSISVVEKEKTGDVKTEERRDTSVLDATAEEKDAVVSELDGESSVLSEDKQKEPAEVAGAGGDCGVKNDQIYVEKRPVKGDTRALDKENTWRQKFDKIDQLLRDSQCTNENEKVDEKNKDDDDNKDAPSSTPPATERRRKPFSCYNCVIFIMDAGLLILSLLYPLLIKSRSKLTLAEQTNVGDNVHGGGADGGGGGIFHSGAVYANASPRSFFRQGSPWHNLLVEDIFDGDLSTLRNHVGAAEWTLVFYYASWDADSMAVRRAFVAAAVSATTTSGLAGVRFAAINCRWRQGSCLQRAAKIKSFPVVYAYNARYRGYIYQGSHEEKGYLAFIDRCDTCVCLFVMSVNPKVCIVGVRYIRLATHFVATFAELHQVYPLSNI